MNPSLSKIFVIHGDPVWRESLIEQLSPNFNVVGIGVNKQESINLIKELQPDIVVIDLYIQGDVRKGLGVIHDLYRAKRAGQVKKGLKIIVATQCAETDVIVEAFLAGVSEYLIDEDMMTLVKTINKITSKITPIEILAKAFRKCRREQVFNQLSNAEIEILRFKKFGYTHTQICRSLHKSKNTLKCQINSLLRKLNLQSCKEAIEEYRDII